MAVPVLSAIAPTASTLIPSNTRVAFTITSSPSLQRVMVFANFPGANIQEVVWDGTAFSERYQGLSTRTAVAGGFAYNVIRTPIWPDSPEISIYAINTSAEELTSTWGYLLEYEYQYTEASPSLPSFPVGIPAESSDSGFVSHNQAYFLSVADQTLEEDYVKGLQAQEGYEILQAQAKIFARVSQAIKNNADGMLAAYARGPALAEGTVEFYRTGTGGGAFTVKSGTIVSAAGGRFFRVLEDAAFTSLDLGPHAVRVRSVFQDYQHNVLGQTITTSGYTINGEIDTITVLIEDPQLQEPAVKVRQITDITGGRSAQLDLLAVQEGLSRRNRETDESLAYRIRNLPDNITPAAIERQVQALVEPYGLRYEFIETWDPTFQCAYDMEFGEPNSNVFVYDDKRARYFRAINWYADDVEQWGTFYINIGKCQPIRDYGGMYDDTAATAGHLYSAISRGYRAVSAYDLPDMSTVGAGGRLGIGYDCRDEGHDALMASIWEMMQTHRAAGVKAGLQQEGRGE